MPAITRLHPSGQVVCTAVRGSLKTFAGDGRLHPSVVLVHVLRARRTVGLRKRGRQTASAGEEVVPHPHVASEFFHFGT